MATVAGHDGHADAGSPIQILRTRLGGRHAELAPQLGDDGRITSASASAIARRPAAHRIRASRSTSSAAAVRSGRVRERQPAVAREPAVAAGPAESSSGSVSCPGPATFPRFCGTTASRLGRAMNSIGKVNVLIRLGGVDPMVAITLDGVLSDHAMLSAVKVMGR